MMPNEEEINLTLADIEDDTVFDELFNDWAVKDLLPYEPEALRTICKIWYGRGVARGTEWAERETARLISNARD